MLAWNPLARLGGRSVFQNRLENFNKNILALIPICVIILLSDKTTLGENTMLEIATTDKNGVTTREENGMPEMALTIKVIASVTTGDNKKAVVYRKGSNQAFIFSVERFDDDVVWVYHNREGGIVATQLV